jgi:hypothetical protein
MLSGSKKGSKTEFLPPFFMDLFWISALNFLLVIADTIVKEVDFLGE